VAITEKRKEYMYQYAKEKLKRIPLDVTKSTYEEIKIHAEAHGESVNGFVKRAISETMERDKAAQDPPDGPSEAP
jgi:predicted HicB family RNase H-like nuclease